MIPKIIHYCWFGGKEKPESVNKNIATWKKFCPDYKIIEWNESNFDIAENDYCREAYEAHKWAFVSDYVRLKVLYKYGGIYMDTDVEVIQSLDEFLSYGAFSGYESENKIPTGTMGGCARNDWIGFLLSDYNTRHFKKIGGEEMFDTTTNTSVITRLTVEKYNLFLDGRMKIFGDNIAIFPVDFFCAKSPDTGKVCKTINTHTIHHFTSSWLPDNLKKKKSFRWWLVDVFGVVLGSIIFKIYDYPRHAKERITQAFEKHVQPFLYGRSKDY